MCTDGNTHQESDLMADQEQVERLTRSIDEWNTWRRQRPHFRPDLSRALLAGANFTGANLSWTNFTGAILSETNLSHTDLFGTNLSWADLFGTNLNRANLCEANLFEANLTRANFFKDNLIGTNLTRANLNGASFFGADLMLRSLNAVTKETAMMSRRLRRSSPNPRLGSAVQLSGSDTSSLLNF
jgi:uncharacterized protein YjbI with pentapeptide repeats